MRSIKVGDKVKIPKTKMGNEPSGNIYKNALKKGLEFLYYHGYDSTYGGGHMLNTFKPKKSKVTGDYYLSGDYYLINEIELYQESLKELNYEIF